MLSKTVVGGFSYGYTYNSDGCLLEKATCGKTLLRYDYNKAGQMTSLRDVTGKTTYYQYDLMGRLESVSDHAGEVIVRYTYTMDDRVNEVIHGNGISTSYEYDAEGNVSRLCTIAKENVLLNLDYTYDGNGNRLKKAGIVPAIVGTGTDSHETAYAYNSKNQLLEECYNGVSTRYEYDPVGNRLSKVIGEDTEYYSYNTKNQLMEQQGKDGRRTFTYDGQGSILKESGTEGVSQYEYDPLNQQTKVIKPNQDVQVNRYDPEGLRAEMEENGTLVRFLFHKGELLVELDEENQPVSRLLRGYGVEVCEQNEQRYYYQKDEQLSTAFITDDECGVQNLYQYDAFGVVREKKEEIENRIIYTGQQYDGVTGQYYLRARYYNPVLGRFLQEDVYRGDGLNLYAYCDNNPVIYYDPSGYAKKSEPYPDLSKINGDGSKGASEANEDTPTTLYHYTNEESKKTILDSQILNPS